MGGPDRGNNLGSDRFLPKKGNATAKLEIRHRKKLLPWLLGAIAICLIAFGGWELARQFRATHNPVSLPTEVVSLTTETPDETPPGKACDDFVVASGLPRKIEIPATGASGCIHRVGIDPEGRIAVPVNIHAGGWFVNSAAPGQKGVAVIDGHVRGQYQKGLFGDLEKLQSGQLVKLQSGDLTWQEFEIVEVVSYPLGEATREQYRQLPDIERQLTLITCAGSFDTARQTYDHRTIVRARLIQ